MQSAKLTSDKYQFCKSLIWLDWNSNSWPWKVCERTDSVTASSAISIDHSMVVCLQQKRCQTTQRIRCRWTRRHMNPPAFVSSSVSSGLSGKKTAVSFRHTILPLLRGISGRASIWASTFLSTLNSSSVRNTVANHLAMRCINCGFSVRNSLQKKNSFAFPSQHYKYISLIYSSSFL